MYYFFQAGSVFVDDFDILGSWCVVQPPAPEMDLLLVNVLQGPVFVKYNSARIWKQVRHQRSWEHESLDILCSSLIWVRKWMNCSYFVCLCVFYYGSHVESCLVFCSRVFQSFYHREERAGLFCLFCLLILFLFSSSLCQGVAAVCDCGTPWTYLLTYLHVSFLSGSTLMYT